MIDDSHLSELERVDVSDPQAALSQILTQVASVNENASGRDAIVADGVADRMQEWLDRIVDKMQQIVRALEDATSSTVSVGTPFNVSVAVTFAKPTR